MDDFNKAVQREGKYWRKNLLWTLGVVAVAAIYFLFFQTGIHITPGEDRITATANKEDNYSVAYADVTAVSLEEAPDYGVCAEGTETRTYRYGRWENETWGSYALCVYTASQSCVVIETADDGILVVNGSSDQDTRLLYELLRQRCPQIFNDLLVTE